MLTYMLIILEVCESLHHSRGTNLHCTPSASVSFCSGELIVLLFAAEMDCSAGRQRSMEFYSVTQLTKCAFIASVTPIINYSPKLSAGLAGCYGNVPQRPPWLHAVAVICLSPVVLFSCLPLMYSPWDTQLSGLSVLQFKCTLYRFVQSFGRLCRNFRKRNSTYSLLNLWALQ